jgi:hypothetical protein
MAMIGKMGTAVGLPSIELSLLFFELAPDWGEAMDQDPVAEGYPGGQHVGVLGTKDLLHQRQQAAYWSRMAAASLAGSRD